MTEPQEKPSKPAPVVISPRSADEFNNIWTLPPLPTGPVREDEKDFSEATRLRIHQEKVLFEGNGQLPDIYRRQKRHIGQLIDACIILDIYEKLPKSGLENLKFHFLGKSADVEKTFDTVKALPRDKQIAALVDLLKPSGAVHLRSHRDLVPPAKWEAYETDFKKYSEAKETYNQLRQFSGGGDVHGLEKPELPEDPRVSLINKSIQNTIQILNSGTKEYGSVERKKNEKKVEMHDMKDLVRLCVFPALPQYGDDLITILKCLNPPKTIDKRTKIIPRIFDEAPGITNNGYYQQQVFIAQDGNAQVDPEPLRGNTGAIAEIQIVPHKMWQVKDMTSITRDLYIRTKAVPGVQDKNVVARRTALMHWYSAEKKEFDELAKRNCLPYSLPAFPVDSADKKKPSSREVDYTNFSQALVDLGLQIHVDAINREEFPEWQQRYLDIAKKQADYGKKGSTITDPNSYKVHYDPKTGRKIERMDKVPEPYLRQVRETLLHGTRPDMGCRKK